VEDIGTSDDQNLLFLSIVSNCYDDVEKLCKYNFEVDYKFETKDTTGQQKRFSAIDKAWDKFVNSNNVNGSNTSNKIILSLLNANSKLPVGFDKSRASPEVQKFIEMSEILHNLIESKNLKLLEEGIKTYPHLWYFYNQNNQSLMAQALEAADIDSFKLLSSLELSIGSHELESHKKLYKNLQDMDKAEIRNQNQDNSIDIPSKHIYALLSKCKTANYNRKRHIYQWKIEEAFEIIDSSAGYPKDSKSRDGRTKVLKIAAQWKKVKIFFDFDNDSTYYFDPTTSITRRGVANSSGIIEIGARELLDEKKKFNVIGTLIHELCHLAMNMIYLNFSNPYQMGESKDKNRFEKKVRVECNNNQDFEKLIKLVYDRYEKKKYNLELVVRPYHMMMKYHNENDKIEECKTKYKKLFSYVEDVVEKELDNTLLDNIWEKLQDDDEIVRFSKLTEPMKANILHQKIYFQNAKTSIFKIIGNKDNDKEILKLLPSDEIKNMSFHKMYEIGDVCEITSKYGFVERKFATHKIHGKSKKSYQHEQTFKQIVKIIKDSNTFILSCKAGEGKSTVFERYCIDLKRDENFKNYWISCLKLKKNQEVLSRFSKNNEDIDIDKISKLICNILLPRTQHQKFKYDSDFEVSIFNKLFLEGKAILFFDGIDEICPDLNEFIIKVLKKIKEYTKNQLWISTRPQHADQIQKELNADVYKLEPYTDRDRKTVVKKIAKKLKAQDQIPSMLNIFTGKFEDFYNPLLIEIIIELYEENGSIIDSNYGKMFEKIIKAQMKKIDSNIDFNDRYDLSNYTLLFHVLALKFLFNEDRVKDLSIMKEYISEKEKKNWTIEKMNRYGFANVNSDFLKKDDKNSISFIHYSYAEYFAAEYIFENIFVKNNNEQQIEKIFSLLESTFESDPTILLSFVKNDGILQNNSQENKMLPNKMKELIKERIEKILNKKSTKQNIQNLKDWVDFLQYEHEVLRELRDKKVEMTNSEIIDRMQELKAEKRVVELLRSILDEWGAEYDEKLEDNLKKLGGEVKKCTTESSLDPNVNWFREIKKQNFIKVLEHNVLNYLDLIKEKYKNNTSMEILREEFGFPSISLFSLYKINDCKSLLTNNQYELQFFTMVNKTFLKLASNDQSYANFSKIVADLQLSEKRYTISAEFIEKLLNHGIYDKVLEQCNSNVNVDVDGIASFIYCLIFAPITITIVPQKIEPTPDKRNFNLKKQMHAKPQKKNRNWKR